MGVEASAEIQNAARRVSEENKRLRHLLNLKGVDQDELNSFLTGNDHEVYHSDGPMLDILLHTRKKCDKPSESSKCNNNIILEQADDEAIQPSHQEIQNIFSETQSSISNSSDQKTIRHTQSPEPEFSMTQPFIDIDYELNGYQDHVTGISYDDISYHSAN